MIAVLGPSPRPRSLIERQFDGDQERLQQLIEIDDVFCITMEDLGVYWHDLAFAELQSDLLRYLFPACLNCWYRSTMDSANNWHEISDFHHALYHNKFLRNKIDASERERLLSFLRDGVLDRIDIEPSFEESCYFGIRHAWICRLNSIGIIAPVISEVFQGWWRIENVGQAISAIEYVSGLVYAIDENPIYGKHRVAGGGGGPRLADFDTFISESGWLDINVDFAKQHLTFDSVIDLIQRSSDLLSSISAFDMDVANLVLRDARARPNLVETRIAALVANIARGSRDQSS